MIIDVHTHICPPDVCQDRACYLLPSENAFCAIYRDSKARLATAEDLIAAMDQGGVDMAVAFGFPLSNEDLARRHNDYVLEAQTNHPDRIIGLACFDPIQPWAIKEAERALAAGLMGLGELALYETGFDDAAIDRLAALANLCREKGRPLLVHVNEPIGHQYPGKAPLSLEMIYRLVQATRGVTLILAHWGGGLFFFNLLKKEVPEALTDVYYDTAASPFLYRPDVFTAAARIVGPEKVLFGTDFPLLKPERYYREIDATGIDPEARRLILGESARALWPELDDARILPKERSSQ